MPLAFGRQNELALTCLVHIAHNCYCAQYIFVRNCPVLLCTMPEPRHPLSIVGQNLRLPQMSVEGESSQC